MTLQQLNDSVVRRQAEAWLKAHDALAAANARQMEPVQVNSIANPGTTFSSIALYQRLG